MPRFVSFVVVAGLCTLGAEQARAQSGTQPTSSAPIYDPRQLPQFRGRVELFTLTPRGDIDGFILTDGTEVKTPPHLTADIAAALKPGDSATIHGLKAASLPLIQAMSVTNDASGRTVVDAGPDAARRPDPRRHEEAAAGEAVSLQGRIRMDLHGPRGDINGMLLDDGSILKLPPPEAARLVGWLSPGQAIAAEGVRRVTALGAVVDLTAIGPVGQPLTRIGAGQRSQGPGTTHPPT